MIFGLTDESYSILSTTTHPADETFYFWVIFISHLYWIIGSILGAIAGKFITYDLSFLKFSLTAMFVVLTIEQAYKVKRAYPFIIAIIAGVSALMLCKPEMLLTAIGSTTLLLLWLHNKGYVT